MDALTGVGGTGDAGPLPPPHHGALARAYAGITATVDGLDDRDMLRATRCRGWVVADLLVHLTGDARRALVALATPTAGPGDTDAVSYWRGFTGPDDGRHAWWVRRSASAFDRPTGTVASWTETASAAVRAAHRADPRGFVATQGHVLSVLDFLATLVTEAVVHHLDLAVELPDAPVPDQAAVDVAVGTVDGLLSDEAVRPTDWSDLDYLLKATGRLSLTEHDRTALGEAAGWFPLLG
ncbi:maleylpyruvate isomerase N-terminal domain-containing protein [Plantactinospora sp. CA-290183]|uniref:maleylpyruvate isomerase N-terminal domain-containing protein n=1 Tax=Plantactinospora sp. CA-290183 TaxID=3240006 RepID=UPI003D8DAE52